MDEFVFCILGSDIGLAGYIPTGLVILGSCLGKIMGECNKKTQTFAVYLLERWICIEEEAAAERSWALSLHKTGAIPSVTFRGVGGIGSP